MHYLNEDPTYLLAGLGLAALGCLVALQVTQQGKYLLWTGGLVVVAALFFAIEQLWVTDAERVEAVVYDLARAVAASDVAKINSYLDADVTLGQRSQTEGLIPIRALLPRLRRVHFDFVRVSQLTAQAGGQTRRGSAEFKIMASGTVDEASTSDLNFAAVASEWSLGFRETAPGVWKINRITGINLPRYVLPVLTR